MTDESGTQHSGHSIEARKENWCIYREMMVSHTVKRLDLTAGSRNSVKHMTLGEAIYLVMEQDFSLLHPVYP